MEERESWLPAGLENSRWEPDDRASQRGDSARGKASRAASTPSASSRDPYDPDRPESKRGKVEPAEQGSAGSSEADSGKPRTYEWTEVEADEAGSESESPKPQQQDAEQTREREPARAEQREERREPERPRESDRDKPSESEQERSTVDAMGQDKHRQVVGQRYGASRARQLAYYGIFIAFVIGAYLGLKAATATLDKAPAHDKDQAPWSKPNAPQGPLGGFVPPGHKGPTRFQ